MHKVQILRDGLILRGWSERAANHFLETLPRVFFNVCHLPTVEAVDALEVYAAYEDVRSK